MRLRFSSKSYTLSKTTRTILPLVTQIRHQILPQSPILLLSPPEDKTINTITLIRHQILPQSPKNNTVQILLKVLYSVITIIRGTSLVQVFCESDSPSKSYTSGYCKVRKDKTNNTSSTQILPQSPILSSP
jgi:hypothetical protein